MYRVAPQWSPNRSDSSDGGISLRAAISVSESRRVRAATMLDLAAADSEPAVSARKKATTPSPAWRPTMPPASTTQRSAARIHPPNEREIPRSRKTTRQRRRRFQIGHQNRRRATIGMLDRPHPFEMFQVHGVGRGGKLRHPRRGLDQVAQTPQGFRERHRSETTSPKPPPLTPTTWTTRRGQATRREDLWVEVGRPGQRTRDRPPDEALLGRPAYSQGRKDQSPRSALDETPVHVAAAAHRRGKPRRLRAKEVEPDRQDRARSCVPVTQPQCVRHEHSRQRASYICAQYPASLSVAAHSAKAGSSGSGSDSTALLMRRKECLDGCARVTRCGGFVASRVPAGVSRECLAAAAAL